MIIDKYVPIIKWKRGEEVALDHLSEEYKSKILPLIEIPPIDYDYQKQAPKKTIDEHIKNIPEQIKSHFGSSKVFLDLYKIYDENLLEDRSHSIDYIINQAIELELDIVPVVSSNENDEYDKALKNLIQNNKVNELCIRIEERDFYNLRTLLDNIIDKYDISYNHCHLVFDLKELTANYSTFELTIPLIINNLTNRDEWISITLASTSFPNSLERVKKNSMEFLPRYELILWNNVSTKLERKIQFGDYCITNPEYTDVDPRYINMSANLRYTVKDKYIVYKGESTKYNGFSQMIAICNNLIGLSYYCGKDYSWGDTYIYDVVNISQSTGNAETWIRIGINHHITYLIKELSSLSYF